MVPVCTKPIITTTLATLSRSTLATIKQQPLPKAVVSRIQYSFSTNSLTPIEGFITFSKAILQQVPQPHEDTLVISVEVGSHLVKRILVDPRTVANLLYLPTLTQMGYHVVFFHSPDRILTGFNDSQTISLEEIMLLVTVGPTTMFVTFSVLDEPSSFNAILGRT